jgi:geranylgeranyl pyrophosphate synthase
MTKKALETMNFEAYSKSYTERIEGFLLRLLSTTEEMPKTLYDAMRYSVFNGGKRIRPLLVYATGEALETPLECLDAAAAAVELIHCYSLIHDDLPCMDNDDLRRGKPTCHKAFDEATAILAGDALLPLAFETLSDSTLNPLMPEKQIAMIKCLAMASGRQGLVGGQMLDMAATGKKELLSLAALKRMHQGKTGALIEASVILAIHASHILLEEAQSTGLITFAKSLGLLFQIQDDILDLTSDTATLGKSIGKDQTQNKVTFPSLLGLEGAKSQLQELYIQATTALNPLAPKGQTLLALANLFITRSY